MLLPPVFFPGLVLSSPESSSYAWEGVLPPEGGLSFLKAMTALESASIVQLSISVPVSSEIAYHLP